jgi:acetoin utilization deacetylase AcuC-like enzyme
MLKIAHSDIYKLHLPEGHRFPMEKYELIPEQLLYEGSAVANNFFEPKAVEEKFILNTHDQLYWQKLVNQTLTPSEVRKTGFPLSKELVQREIYIAQGTIDCANFALEYGVAMNVAGGTHHAFTNRGEGFCLLNDVAIASNYLLENQLSKKILVVDLDVHQGNGTAEIFRTQPQVFTFSMHGEKNYPLQKEKSDLDVGLADGIDDKNYLNLLYKHLPELLERFQPDFIFYISGVDILETDKLGRLGVTLAGCKQRDKYVLQMCHQNKIPVAVSMGGGYSPRISDIVEAHVNTFRVAQEIYF